MIKYPLMTKKMSTPMNSAGKIKRKCMEAEHQDHRDGAKPVDVCSVVESHVWMLVRLSSVWLGKVADIPG